MRLKRLEIAGEHRRMIRLTLAAIACLAVSGCFNWQGTYDSAARRNCNELIDARERLDCLNSVQRNAGERNADRRS